MISIDSYGWIARFTNGPKAKAFNRIIDEQDPAEIVISSIALYEVYRKIKMMKGEQQALAAHAALSQTSIQPVDETIALEASDYSLQHNLHMADALIYATARHFDAELYTSDEDLKGLKGVHLL